MGFLVNKRGYTCDEALFGILIVRDLGSVRSGRVCRKPRSLTVLFSFGLNPTPCLMRFQRWVSALTKRSRCTAIAVPITVPLVRWGVIAPEWADHLNVDRGDCRILKGVRGNG